MVCAERNLKRVLTMTLYQSKGTAWVSDIHLHGAVKILFLVALTELNKLAKKQTNFPPKRGFYVPQVSIN